MEEPAVHSTVTNLRRTSAPGGYQHHSAPDFSQQSKEESLAGASCMTSSNDATIIREIPEEGTCSSITGVLRHCKRRILYPYLKLLGIIGLKPWNADAQDLGRCTRIVNKVYIVLVIILVITGYVIQFLTCFRRDYGFNYKWDLSLTTHSQEDFNDTQFTNDTSNPMDKPDDTHNRLMSDDPHFETTTLKSYHQPKSENEHDIFPRSQNPNGKELFHNICAGNSFYIYFIPSFLHLIAFGYMLCLYWLNHDEQLPNLMERVFIQATQAHSIYFSQKRVIRTLKFLVFFGLLWLICSAGCLLTQIIFTHIHLNFFPHLGEMEMRTLASVMGFSTLWQDTVQVTIIVSYCIHCHLLSMYLDIIHSRISQHSLTLSECIKEIGEIDKLLGYINVELASGMLPLIMLDTMFSIGSVLYLMGKDPGFHPYTMLISVFSCIQWTFLVALPLIQGARLNTALKKVRELGHLVRTRPFGYQGYEQNDLDSFLLFVSTIKMDVRIMKLPLTGTNISMLFSLLTFLIFLWGYAF